MVEFIEFIPLQDVEEEVYWDFENYIYDEFEELEEHFDILYLADLLEELFELKA